MDTCNEKEEEEEEVPPPNPIIQGDMLEAILSHVPLISLLPASHVSRSWNDAVSSALLLSNNPPNPWLIVHKQNSRHPYPTTTHAYDPTANSWIRILHPPIDNLSTLRSSHSNLLYMLSPSNLSFSSDPLHLTWHHAPPPRVSRIDPVVAVVGGGRAVVAGGAYDFEDDPLAVEVYDLGTRRWTKSDPMPESFAGSASSLWISVASCDSKLFVMEKSSGVTHSFDPDCNSWSGPYDLRPDHRVFHSVIGFSDNELFVIGILGDGEDFDFDGFKIWKVMNCDSFEFEEIGEMPADLVEDLKRRDLEISSIDLSMAGNMAYIHVSSRPEEVIVCEFIDGGGGCRWRSVVNTVAIGRNVTDRLVFTVAKVGMEELQRATRSENRRFVVKR